MVRRPPCLPIRLLPRRSLISKRSRSLKYKGRYRNQLHYKLSDTEKLWIDAHSKEELEADLRRAAYGSGVRDSSQHRGVRRIPDSTLWPWRATQYLTINTATGPQHVIWTQSFKDEESAARAWDRVAVQYCGRCCAGASMKLLMLVASRHIQSICPAETCASSPSGSCVD